VTELDIDPRWAPHISGAQRVNEVLREMGDLIPPMDTPEQIAAMRVLPDAFRDLELALPMENRTIPGPAGNIRARVAVPPTVRAVYLDIHGGGFCMGWPEMKDATNARLALAADIAIISIDYRLAPEHPYPAGPDDCYPRDRLADRSRLGGVRHPNGLYRRRFGWGQPCGAGRPARARTRADRARSRRQPDLRASSTCRGRPARETAPKTLSCSPPARPRSSTKLTYRD